MDLDQIVREKIELCFPNQPTPDENNYLPDGNQFKAPDHSLFGGKILIERKSRRSESDRLIYERVRKIAKSQGKTIFGVGQVGINQMLDLLPDPAAASREVTDYLMGQIFKSIKSARAKFDSYAKHRVIEGQLRVVVFSDMSASRSATDMHEYFLGRKMGGVSACYDELSNIDAIVFIKDPSFVIRCSKSYWIKCLQRNNLSDQDKSLVEYFVSIIHRELLNDERVFPSRPNFSADELYILNV